MIALDNVEHDFHPPWYLRSGHIQTILTGFHKPKAKLPAPTIHRLSMEPAGGVGELLVYENGPIAGNLFSPPQDAVFLFHGLGSSHRGSYMTYLASLLLERGFRVFRFDLPGAGDSYHHSQLPPHGACSEILWHALQALSDRLGIYQWRGAGVSLGGNLLLRMLIDHADELETRGRVPSLQIVRGVAVAPPIDLARCCLHMERGIHRIYARYFLRSLRRQSLLRASKWPAWAERMPGADFRTIRRFDETVTAPLAGFANADAYYATGSTLGELHKIRTPTTVLIDEHDPIVPFDLFKGVDWSPTTEVRVTRRGGHVGYLCRNPFGKAPRHIRWSDQWGVEALCES